jgi:LCP family protein required for cell wall assembly
LKKKFKILWIRVFSFLFFFLLGLLGIFMVYLHFVFEGTEENRFDFGDNRGDLSCLDTGILNILVLGVDTLASKSRGRSDSVVLVSLDEVHKKIKITSIMRDLWVNVPGHDWDRLNSAYPLGGASLAVQTIEKNFGIKIDRFVSVDFPGFEKIIDSLGGLELKLEKDEIYFINNNAKSRVESYGNVKLNGNQVLQFARDRDSSGSDFDRTKRQREVIVKVVEKLKCCSFAKLSAILVDILKCVKTNCKYSELIGFCKRAPEYSLYETLTFRLPTSDNFVDAVVDGKQVLKIPDLNKARKDIQRFVMEI